MNDYMKLKIGDKKKAYCVSCGGQRNCLVHGVADEGEEDQEIPWWYTKRWFLLQCCGCDTNFVQTVATHSEDYSTTDDGQNVQNHTITYWPAPSKRKRPDWFEDSFLGLEGNKSSELDLALEKLYGALDAELRLLSAIGVRTVFDVASEVLGVNPSRPFVGKLDDLVDGGHIGSVDRDRLSILVDAGSASAHRGWRPSFEALGTMMDILEHFLFRTFVEPHRRLKLDEKTEAMKGKFPKRNAKPELLVPPSPADEPADDITL